jgi:YidC/Oxa1 family membrane protein insertase
MIDGFGELIWDSQVLLNSHTRFLSRAGSARQFGTVLGRNGVISRSNGGSITLGSRRIGGSMAAVAGLTPNLVSRQQRFASTQPSSVAEGVPSTGDGLTTDASPLPFDFTGDELLNMPEKIGYLHAMGLEYGWGPTSMMQWLLEHIYIYSGMPWWASIAAVAIIVRAAIFKASLTAAEHTHRLQELRKNPRFEEASRRMQEAILVSKNQEEMMNARMEVLKMQKAAGIQTWRTFVPLVNLPVAFGMLRLVRGMAALPVPSLETGGMLWFTNLTVPDPLFILPVAGAVLMTLSMRVSPSSPASS